MVSPPRGARDNPFDLLIIGGGINGAGVARDATLRGMSVALMEMRDFSSGATWASSGMIHGGLRYLSSNPEVTRLSCLDSGFIQEIAPHLIFRIPFIVPWMEGGFTERVVFELAEIYFDTYDRYQPLKRGKPHSRMTPEEMFHLEPGLTRAIQGGLSMDEWGIDSQRLTIINALDAAERGADVRTWTRVDSLIRDGKGAVIGVHATDRLGGGSSAVFAKTVLNATGPWAMNLAEREEIERVKVRPGKGVHLVYAGRITNYAVLANAVDGRQIFICPHQNHTLVGTTDDDYYGDLEQIPVTHDEVSYLIEGASSMFPSLNKYPLIGTTVGCRPTIYEYGKMEDALSREHLLFDHNRDGADGFYSLIGGKLASYRIMAEEAVDAIAARVGNHEPCRTATEVLPGGDEHDLTISAFTELGVPGPAAQRILYRHGSRAERIRRLMVDEPATRAIVDPTEPITEAELRVVMRTERVRVLDDLKRRCRLGQGHDGGAKSIARAAQIFCEEMGLDDRDFPDVAREFMLRRWEDRRGIANVGSHQREALTRSTFFLSSGLGMNTANRGAGAQ